LHVDLGVDYIVDEIKITKGINLPKSYDPLKNPDWSIKTWNLKSKDILVFGSSPEEVIKRFGKPTEDYSIDLMYVIKYKYSYDSSKENKRKAFRHWKTCIYSGMTVKIEMIEGESVSMGWCNKGKKDWIGKWVDFEIECSSCKKHKFSRTPPKHVRTATRIARISTARRRSISKSNDLIEMRRRQKIPSKKH